MVRTFLLVVKRITISIMRITTMDVVRLSSIEEKVIWKIRHRAKVGKTKYGVTMEREDLNITEWLVHLQEELLDASVYVQRLINDVNIANKAIKDQDLIDIINNAHEAKYGVHPDDACESE